MRLVLHLFSDDRDVGARFHADDGRAATFAGIRYPQRRLAADLRAVAALPSFKELADGRLAMREKVFYLRILVVAFSGVAVSECDILVVAAIGLQRRRAKMHEVVFHRLVLILLF